MADAPRKPPRRAVRRPLIHYAIKVLCFSTNKGLKLINVKNQEIVHLGNGLFSSFPETVYKNHFLIFNILVRWCMVKSFLCFCVFAETFKCLHFAMNTLFITLLIIDEDITDLSFSNNFRKNPKTFADITCRRKPRWHFWTCHCLPNNITKIKSE